MLSGSADGLVGLGIATTNALLQVLESLSWCVQKGRNLFDQDFRAISAWCIISGHIESGARSFPEF